MGALPFGGDVISSRSRNIVIVTAAVNHKFGGWGSDRRFRLGRTSNPFRDFRRGSDLPHFLLVDEGKKTLAPTREPADVTAPSGLRIFAIPATARATEVLSLGNQGLEGPCERAPIFLKEGLRVAAAPFSQFAQPAKRPPPLPNATPPRLRA